MNLETTHFSIKYSAKLVASAARYYFLQAMFIKRRSYWRDLVIIIVLLIGYVIDPERNVQYVLGVGGLALFALWCRRWWVYRAMYRMLSSNFGTTLNEEKTFHVESDGLMLLSPNGETRIVWSSINQVWNYPRFLFLFFERKVLFFPIAEIGEDARKNILKHLPGKPPVLGKN